MSIPVFKPSIKRKEMQSVLSCLVTDVIGPASLARDLVDSVAAELGLTGGVALREHVRAIEIVFDALDLAPGEKVLISPLSPSAYGRVMESRGIVPVFADIKQDNATMDPLSVKARMTDDVRAIVVHTPLGQVPDMESFEKLPVPVIMDIGEALGAQDQYGYLGSNADYVILPMEAEGIVTSGGGTLVLVRGKPTQNRLVAVAESLSKDAFLPDFNASLGLIQWRGLSDVLQSRDMIYDVFLQSVMKGRHRTLAGSQNTQMRPVPYSFPVVLSGGMSEVRQYALRKGIETLPAFTGRLFDLYARAVDECPHAQSLVLGTVLFPLYPALGKKNVQLIGKVLSTLP